MVPALAARATEPAPKASALAQGLQDVSAQAAQNLAGWRRIGLSCRLGLTAASKGKQAILLLTGRGSRGPPASLERTVDAELETDARIPTPPPPPTEGIEENTLWARAQNNKMMFVRFAEQMTTSRKENEATGTAINGHQRSGFQLCMIGDVRVDASSRFCITTWLQRIRRPRAR